MSITEEEKILVKNMKILRFVTKQKSETVVVCGT